MLTQAPNHRRIHDMIRFLVALFLTVGLLTAEAAQSNYVPLISTTPVTPVPPVANPALANFATTNISQVLTQIVQSLAGGGGGTSRTNWPASSVTNANVQFTNS